jgi:hypothetical protein
VNLRARPGFARTILAGYIGSSLLIDGVADVAAHDYVGWLWVTFGAGAFLLLVQHLREQALRDLNRPGAAWARVDTANAIILAVLATVMILDAHFSPDSPAAEAATYTLATTYVALLADFTIQRRHTARTAGTHTGSVAT